MTRKIIVLLCIFSFTTSFVTGCDFSMEPAYYRGERMDLYTVASFSILGVEAPNTSISVIETDNYGRTLFETRFAGDGSDLFYFQKPLRPSWLYAYIVSQKTEQKDVYYYEDECWSVFEKPDDFAEKDKAELLERNDWNKPLDQERMTSRRIIESDQLKTFSTAIYDKQFKIQAAANNIVSDFVMEKKDFPYKYLLDIDKDGRSIFVAWICHNNGVEEETNNTVSVTAYFILIRNDCSYDKNTCIYGISDMQHYWRELMDFKKLNSWNS